MPVSEVLIDLVIGINFSTMRASMVREKKIMCGKNYMEVDIYPYTMSQKEARSKKRGKRKNVSLPKQRNLNDKNSKRYLIQLLNSNFTDKDYHLYFSYTTKHHPDTIEEAEAIFKNYLRRVNYRRKQKGIGPAKYIVIMEYDIDKDDNPKHIHHHLVIDGELSRDELEDLWRMKRDKGQKKGPKIGRCSGQLLEPDNNGLAGLAMYLTKRGQSKRKWSPSQNLTKPVEMPVNDTKYTKRQLDRIAKGLTDKEYWRRKYKGWRITDEDYGIQVSFNEFTGYHIYLRLRKDTG